jgi:hypothetical protein
MKFDFRKNLQGKDAQYLTQLRESILQDLFEFIACGHKESNRLKTYLGYIDTALANLNK